MTLTEHETFAKEVLSSLAGDLPGDAARNFAPDRTKKGNAARAISDIVCNRLFANSGVAPALKTDVTYQWKDGILNIRTIADRPYLWTNLRPRIADSMHELAKEKPAAYLLSSLDLGDGTLYAWVVPEPVLYDILPNLPVKRDGGRNIQISREEQRIKDYAASPDFAPYFLDVQLSQQELAVLRASGEVDAFVKAQRKIAKENSRSSAGADTTEDLTAAELGLEAIGAFDPSGISDARERVFSSIVRRRGQSAFRRALLEAYGCRCAITGCTLEAVLDAAHIIPYKGEQTHHPGNGILLRTDLHTLFDLKLIAVNVANMTLIVSPALAGTSYEKYRERIVRIPDDPSCRPSREALGQHRRQSGL